jgi:hypothetical protein
MNVISMLAKTCRKNVYLPFIELYLYMKIKFILYQGTKTPLDYNITTNVYLHVLFNTNHASSL